VSKNASSVSNRRKEVWKPDNPQETLNEAQYYFAGLMAAEMTCSVIKAANHNPVGHFYFAVDITVTNADRKLLAHFNAVVLKHKGVISPVKGAYNLSARGKERVRMVLAFLDRFPIIAGDSAQSRIELMREALAYLDAHKGSRAHQKKVRVMDSIRTRLRAIKETDMVLRAYPKQSVSEAAIGHFLAGVLAGEGSFGCKKSGTRRQPYLFVAMKDRKIVELFRDFIGHGNMRQRKDGLYHYELNHREILQKVVPLFLTTYPLRHVRQLARMRELQRILNDYTRNRALSSDDIV
jgi:hypothetical protein